MTRQPIEGGMWFDRDSAITFDESTWWDGSNLISGATGSQWEHESLWYTRQGRWVLHTYSQWQGSPEMWQEIDAADAARWLVAQRATDDPEDSGLAELPAAVQEDIMGHTRGLEV